MWEFFNLWRENHLEVEQQLDFNLTCSVLYAVKAKKMILAGKSEKITPLFKSATILKILKNVTLKKLKKSITSLTNNNLLKCFDMNSHTMGQSFCVLSAILLIWNWILLGSISVHIILNWTNYVVKVIANGANVKTAGHKMGRNRNLGGWICKTNIGLHKPQQIPSPDFFRIEGNTQSIR